MMTTLAGTQAAFIEGNITFMAELDTVRQLDEFEDGETPTGDILSIVAKVYYPLVVLVGLTGNILNIIILSRPSMIKYTSTVYLLGLAVADITVLLFQTTFKYVIYKAFGVKQPHGFHVFQCVYNQWLTIGAIRTSFWITVGFTIERFIAIAFPLQGKRWCTMSRAKKTVVFLFLCGYSYGTHALVLREVTSDNMCVFTEYGESIRYAITKMNAASYGITFALLAIFNGLIIFTTCRQNSRRGSLETSGYNVRQHKITMTLLAVSIVFMFLWSPWLAIYLRSELPNNKPGLHKADPLALKAEFMGVLNSAVNFFLYNVTSTKFRREFKSLVGMKTKGFHASVTSRRINTVSQTV